MSPGFSKEQDLYWGDHNLALDSFFNGWTEHPSPPMKRSGHGCVWDTTGGRMYMTGGTNSSSLQKDLDSWSYDPATESWTKMGNLSYGAGGFATVWDTTRAVMIIYGGHSELGGAPNFGPMTFYEYNPAKDNLTRKADGPFSTSYPTAVWDDADQQMLIFGGIDASFTDTNNLWSYKPSTDSWRKLTSGATPRKNAASTWDPVHKKMFIYGGSHFNGQTNTDLSDLWSYEPATDKWERKAQGPSILSYENMVYDLGDNVLVLYGYRYGSRLWTYYPGSDVWSPIMSGLQPMPRSEGCMVWDSKDNEAILLDGWAYNSNILNDVWTWKGPPSMISNGWLESSTMDTGVTFQYSNISWNPTTFAPGVGAAPVKVQLATSNSSSGPWTYVGPDGSPSAYYTKSGQGIGSAPGTGHYFRYKVFLSTDTPNVSPYIYNISISYMQYNSTGFYTSRIIDLGSDRQIRMWMNWYCAGNSSKGVDIMMRWSQSPDMSHSTYWVPTENGTKIKTNNTRYFQYRVRLSSTDPTWSPFLKKVEIAVNCPPALFGGGVDLSEGLNDTMFSYTVTYWDPDGDVPVTALIYIDNASKAMTTRDSSFTTGCVYNFSTRLGLGNHSYVFYFSDGDTTVRFPAAGLFYGPFVDALPTARLSSNQTIVLKGEPLSLDASRSSGPFNKIGTYNFDFGDNQSSDWVDSPYLNHTYMRVGMFKVSLAVKDVRGHVSTNIATMNVTVRAAPKARFCEPAYTVEEGKPVIVDASWSSDEDGKIVLYTFDFGDGSDVNETTAKNTTHTYALPGNYTVKLVVKDNDGILSKTATAKMEVTKKVQPKPPPKPKPPPGGIPSGSMNWFLVAAIVAAITAVAGVAAFLTLRSRRNKKEATAQGQAPPPPPSFVGAPAQSQPYDPNLYQQQTYYQDQQGNYYAYGQDQNYQQTYDQGQQYPPPPQS
jgi:PKD repeat protein/N-acetylneuraminic acid mutarotase